jgi:multimeric flavodoxin WrbA
MSALKILAVSSSPRRGGNSETMLDAAAEAARAAGAEVEKIVLRDLGFKPCLNCGGCSKTGRCVLDDEYSELNGKIRGVDRLVLASPIYMGSLSAQMKCLVDRGQPFWAERFLLRREPEERGRERRALFICCGGFRKGDKFLANAEQILKIYLLCLGFAHAGTVFEPGVDEKGAINDRPEALERCRQAGAELAGR